MRLSEVIKETAVTMLVGGVLLVLLIWFLAPLGLWGVYYTEKPHQGCDSSRTLKEIQSTTLSIEDRGDRVGFRLRSPSDRTYFFAFRIQQPRDEQRFFIRISNVNMTDTRNVRIDKVYDSYDSPNDTSDVSYVVTNESQPFYFRFRTVFAKDVLNPCLFVGDNRFESSYTIQVQAARGTTPTWYPNQSD